jgi:putative endonuclease
MKQYCIYILSSQKNGTLYIGVTSNLARRIYEHQHYLIPGFTHKYKVNILIHVEQYATMLQAIKREKQLKQWLRVWKIKLIEENNPEWKDLANSFL